MNARASATVCVLLLVAVIVVELSVIWRNVPTLAWGNFYPVALLWLAMLTLNPLAPLLIFTVVLLFYMSSSANQTPEGK